MNDCQAIDEKSPTETYSEDVVQLGPAGPTPFCPNSVDQSLHNRKFTSHGPHSTGPHVDMTINNLAKKTIIEALNK